MHGRGPRSFDPVMVGRRECEAWVAYYRREWRTFLVACVGMVHAGFGMNTRRTLTGAWHVLRANQAWAPYPDNDPDLAREHMRRFYVLAADAQLPIDPAQAARREVEWWRVHRAHQHAHQHESGASETDLTDALVELYAYVYGVEDEAVRDAAEHRVAAMRLSDAWVAAGCDPADPLLADERRRLVASYTALRDAIDRA
jgi:hypothetical protein